MHNGFPRKVLYLIVPQIGTKHGINQSKRASVRAIRVHRQLNSSSEISWMVWEAGLGGDQIPTVEDEDQAASEPDDHTEKPMNMESWESLLISAYLIVGQDLERCQLWKRKKT